MNIEVRHIPEQNRFQAVVEGHTCVADYHLNDDVMHMTHTFVPHPVEGRGVAAQLVAAALAYARAQKLRVNPVCSYVRAYMQSHPETRPLHV